MPKIDWIGREAVVRHHSEVPYRLVHCDRQLSAGDAAAGNLLVQGDNLEALRALLPYYAARVKCIYIDPPYNTGNEGWKYNDRVNSPQIRRWLDKVVGGEADDLCRHDKWLCMMYPRLRLLRDFLREDGVIFVSIDDNEQHRLRMLMDEIFGANNFVANLGWQKKFSRQSDAKFFSDTFENILVYARSKTVLSLNLLVRTEKQDNRYTNPDNDPRGVWSPDNMVVKTYSPEYDYPIKTPTGRVVNPARGFCWRFPQKRFWELVKDDRIWFGKTGNNIPRLKRFLADVQEGLVPMTLWLRDFAGDTQEAVREVKQILTESKFDSPKPVKLVKRILSIATDKDSIIMDSFAGSGTTAHAVLQQNKADGGDRKFVLVEMDEDISQNITAKRIQKAIKGYKTGDKKIAPLGGGLHYCTLGKPLFDENGNIGGAVKFSDLAAHIFFSETGTPIQKRAKTPLLGVDGDRAIYLLFNGIMGDKKGNALTTETLRALHAPPGKNIRRIVFAESTLLSKERLAREKIEFRQIPYKIRLR